VVVVGALAVAAVELAEEQEVVEEETEAE
jgi:rRNA 2'-O-methyltransferase fibrillarin